MGLLLSSSFRRAALLLPYLRQFFCSICKPVFSSRPATGGKPSRAGAVKAGRLFGDHPQGFGFTVSSTAALSNLVGLGQQDDDQRGARVRARSIAPQPCIRWVQEPEP